MGLICTRNNPAILSDLERSVFAAYRDRLRDAEFIDREISQALPEMVDAILQADHDHRSQRLCPFHGKDLWEIKPDGGRHILVPLS